MEIEFKRNIPKVDVMSYRHLIRGIPKIGKTTIFRDIIKQLYGDTEYGLLIAIGNELGYKAIQDIFAIEASNWMEFKKVVDKLIDDKEDHKFKVIGFDTIDQLVEIAEEEAKRVHRMRTGTRVASINEAMGGYGRGQKYARKIISDQISRLERAGFGMMFIGHTKVRDIEEKGSGEKYQMLTGNLDGRYDSLFTDMVDVVATMYMEKEVDGSRLSKTKRWIYFRSDGFIDAGTRFPYIEERVELSGENYIHAIEKAIVKSFGSNISKNELSKIKEKEVEDKETDAKEYVQMEKSGNIENAEQLNTIEEYVSMIGSRVGELSPELKKQIREELSEEDIDVTKYKEETDIEILKEILRKISLLG